MKSKRTQNCKADGGRCGMGLILYKQQRRRKISISISIITSLVALGTGRVRGPSSLSFSNDAAV